MSLPGTCGRPTAYGGYCNRISKDGGPCSSHRPQRVGARSCSVTDRRRAAETTWAGRSSSDTDLPVTPTQHTTAVMYPPISRIWRFSSPSSPNEQPWIKLTFGGKWGTSILIFITMLTGAMLFTQL